MQRTNQHVGDCDFVVVILHLGFVGMHVWNELHEKQMIKTKFGLLWVTHGSDCWKMCAHTTMTSLKFSLQDPPQQVASDNTTMNSNKLNCFIKWAGLFDHPTSNTNSLMLFVAWNIITHSWLLENRIGRSPCHSSAVVASSAQQHNLSGLCGHEQHLLCKACVWSFWFQDLARSKKFVVDGIPRLRHFAPPPIDSVRKTWR